MTARDFVASLAPVDLDRQSKIFRYLAEHSYEARLEDGKQLRDASDFKQWLAELAYAAEVRHARPCRRVMGTFTVADPCPRCGHVHQGSKECGEQMGGGRICRCEMEVWV